MGNVKTAQNPELRSPAALSIRLFGPLNVQVDGKPVVIASKKARALLAYLIQRQGVEIARNVLTGLLWGERSEAQARASLRQTLSELRGALAGSADAIIATKESVSWSTTGAWIDTKALEAAAKSDDDESASLFTGDFLEGLSIDEPAFEQWLAGERERFRLLAATIHTRLMERAEQDGDVEEAVNHGLKLLSLDPLQEHVHRALMRLYAAQGRHDAALAQYERCQRELQSQLGVRPDAATETLARSIRASRREGTPKPEIKPPPPAMPDKPSIVVLPFSNLSSDRERGFFADGMTEDIIAALSRVKELFVISRNSSFVYKDRPARAEDIAKELGVRFILEGSVRAAGNRVRVAAQLIDGASGGHLWAERYEGELNDIFAVQDQITHSIALAMQVRLTHGEMARFWEGQTRDLRAWEKMVAAREAFLRFNRMDNLAARHLLDDALRVDPRYTGAIVLRGMTFWWDARFNSSIDKEHSLRLAEGEAERVAALNPDLGIGHMLRAGIAHLRDQHDEAICFAEQAVELSPSDSHSVAFLGMVYMYAGEFEKSLVTVKQAARLSPHSPSWYTYYLALANMWLNNAAAATELGELYLRQEPEEPFAYANLAIILSFQKRTKEAAHAIATLRERFPSFGMRDIKLSQRYREPSRLEKVIAALREAGLPEP